MRKTYRPKKKVENKKIYQKNERIFAFELRVIDEEAKPLGVLSKEKALEIAKERGLDLVLVSPKANPPVAKLIDYGKFQYQQEKQLQKQKAKQKKTTVKCVRLSIRISKHDKEIRIQQSLKFLAKGHKVKFELTLRGREHKHIDLAKELLNDILNNIAEQTEIMTESPIEKQGSKLITIIANKK